MKRILALILCILMILPLIACGAKEPATETDDAVETKENKEDKKTEENEEEKKTEEEKKNEEAPSVNKYNHVVNDPLTWDDINAIPIAKPGMTTQEYRDICVAFFDLSMSFTWIPDREYNYVVESQNLARVLEQGKLTGGLPYITVGYGNLYRFMDYYNSETGVMDLSSFMTDPKRLGNACSGGASLGWARCINSITKPQWTWGMTHANGFLRVGPYTYDESLTAIGKEDGDYGAPEIVAKNGKQVMFESYAAAHKADGIVNTGHVRMICEEPVVVRNSDGTINGGESYLVCHDQICYNTVVEKYQRVQEDGTTYHIAGGNNWKYSFNELYGTNYIPFTFAEFLGTDPVEESKVEFTHSGETASVYDLNGAKINANYLVLDYYLHIKDAEGNVVFSYSKENPTFMKNTMDLQSRIPLSAVNKYADGNHTVEVSCQLGNGERPVIYTGKLVGSQY